jgi:tetratricopeptide (TPR) repeat protein
MTTFKLARCYYRLNDFERALPLLNELKDIKEPPGPQSVLLAAEINSRLSNYEKVLEGLRDINYSRALFLKGHANFKLDHPDRARDCFKKISKEDSLFTRAAKLSEFLETPWKIKDKSYVPAGFLALVPGCGHLYTGRKGDALFSAVLIWTCAAVSYFYYDNGSNSRAIAAGTAGGIFYAGSVYGALMGVKIFNREQRSKYHRKFDEIYGQK